MVQDVHDENAMWSTSTWKVCQRQTLAKTDSNIKLVLT